MCPKNYQIGGNGKECPRDVPGKMTANDNLKKRPKPDRQGENDRNGEDHKTFDGYLIEDRWDGPGQVVNLEKPDRKVENRIYGVRSQKG